MNRRFAFALATSASLFFASPFVSAQVIQPVTGAGSPEPSMGMRGDSSEPAPNGPRSVKLFDTKSSENGYVLSIGPIWSRKAEETTPSQNRENYDRGLGELSLGSAMTTALGPFYITGSPRTLLRIFDSKRVSWSIFQEEFVGGLRIGPLEPEAGIGLSLMSIDVFNAEWSAQLFSPRVMAGVGLHLGKFKVDIKGHAEYLWRWFGPDYYVRGITLGIRFDAPRKNMFRDDPGRH